MSFKSHQVSTLALIAAAGSALSGLGAFSAPLTPSPALI
jgi:hypothetical protein